MNNERAIGRKGDRTKGRRDEGTRRVMVSPVRFCRVIAGENNLAGVLRKV